MRTPFYDTHKSLGAKIVDFHGWEMPLQYSGIVDEHINVRNNAGLFDVSHMGEIGVRGAGAIAFINRITSNDVSKLVDGQAQYSTLTTPEGTVIDDLLVYRLAADHLLLVVNARTTEKDWEWIKSHYACESVELNNVSADYYQLALQGPDAQSILQKLTELRLEEIFSYINRRVLFRGQWQYRRGRRSRDPERGSLAAPRPGW